VKAMALRYAAALAGVVMEQNGAEAARASLGSFRDAYVSSAELRNFLGNPAVPRQKKQNVIEQLGAVVGMGTAVRNFLFLLVDNRRINDLPEIAKGFQEELNRRTGRADAEITAPRGLSDGEKAELVAALERMTGMKIEAHYAEDSGLIAGAVVRIGSTIYDGSVRDQLVRLRADLEAEG
jgi:F-type H+-transporting ATPase subunit delta